MMKFVVYSDEQRTQIALEQAVDDVVIRANGMGVATFQAQDGVLRVSKQGLSERGITLVVEEIPPKVDEVVIRRDASAFGIEPLYV